MPPPKPNIKYNKLYTMIADIKVIINTTANLSVYTNVVLASKRSLTMTATEAIRAPAIAFNKKAFFIKVKLINKIKFFIKIVIHFYNIYISK